MSGLGPLDLQRMAALTMSGFGSSKDALDTVANHVGALCSDIVERHKARLESVLSGRDIADLAGEEKASARIAWAELRSAERIQAAIPRTLGIYAGLLFRLRPTQDEAETALFLLAQLADDLVQVGANYMVGRTEDDLPPPITVTDIARKGGEARARNDEKTKKPVKDLFAELCADLMRGADTMRAAELIRAAKKQYGNAKPVLPGDRQLSTWLNEAIEAGFVPAPRKDGRAKKVTKSAG